MAKTVKINIQIRPGIDNVVGRPVFTTPENIVGVVIDYSKETGKAVIEVDGIEWEKIFTRHQGLGLATKLTLSNEESDDLYNKFKD